MSPTQPEPSGARARTRRAILDAAVSVLGRNPSASLNEIAGVAQTARSTVHRHFPERASLLTALEDYANQALADAAERARLGEGEGASALLRLCQHYFDHADLVMVAYGNLSHAEEIASLEWVDEGIADLVTRGHTDGSIDPALTALWIQQLLWSMLYAAWLMARSAQVSNHEALGAFLDAFEKVLTRRPAQKHP